jgi:hypothetical protein
MMHDSPSQEWFAAASICDWLPDEPQHPSRYSIQLGADLQYPVAVCIPSTSEDVVVVRNHYLSLTRPPHPPPYRLYLLFLPVSGFLAEEQRVAHSTTVPSLQCLRVPHHSRHGVRCILAPRIPRDRTRNVGASCLIFNHPLNDNSLPPVKTLSTTT